MVFLNWQNFYDAVKINQESDAFTFIVVFTGQRTQAPQPYGTFTY